MDRREKSQVNQDWDQDLVVFVGVDLGGKRVPQKKNKKMRSMEAQNAGTLTWSIHGFWGSDTALKRR